MPVVSIIIVNYYSENEIIRCINSIHAHSGSTTSYEIIVVSNSPLDKKAKNKINELRKTFVIQCEYNGGFAKGCNTGAATAKGKYIYFLNPDTRFLNNTIKKLLAFYNSIEDEIIVAPFTYDVSGNLKATAKNHLSWITLLHEALPITGLFIPDTMKSGHISISESKQVDVVQGSAMFLSKSTYDKLGGMDERFFMYWEENDLCLRASNQGINTYIIESAKIEHKGAFSTSKHFIKMFLTQHASRKLFIEKHIPHINRINQILGIIGYGWRTVAVTFLWDKKRIKQFYSALKWYLLSYKKVKSTNTLPLYEQQHDKKVYQNKLP